MNVVTSSSGEVVATAGQPLDAGIPPVSEAAVIEALRNIYDPEIPVNIYDLGLIYGLSVGQDDGSVTITMTLTAPSCPVAGALPQQVADTVAAIEGAGEVRVLLAWEPPWTMENMSEDARLALNLY